MLLFEKVSLNLATTCGAIPLDNFLANDYDDGIELDYREFESELGKHDRDDTVVPDKHILGSTSPKLIGAEDPCLVRGTPTQTDQLKAIDARSTSGQMHLDLVGVAGSHDEAPLSAGPGDDSSCALTNRSPIGDDASMIVTERLPGSAASTPYVSGSGKATLLDLLALREQALDKLYKACTRLSGTAEALHFDFIEEDLSCKLAIFRNTEKRVCRAKFVY